MERGTLTCASTALLILIRVEATDAVADKRALTEALSASALGCAKGILVPDQKACSSKFGLTRQEPRNQRRPFHQNSVCGAGCGEQAEDHGRVHFATILLCRQSKVH